MSIDASCRRLTYRPWFKRRFVIGGPWLYQARELEFAAHLDSGRSTILTWPIHFTRREAAHDQFHNTPDLQPVSGNPGLRRHSLTWYCGIDAVRNRHMLCCAVHAPSRLSARGRWNPLVGMMDLVMALGMIVDCSVKIADYRATQY
jgi:hypothetical protein